MHRQGADALHLHLSGGGRGKRGDALKLVHWERVEELVGEKDGGDARWHLGLVPVPKYLHKQVCKECKEHNTALQV